jgi:arylsulfatase A-like enzyme/Flp pilus assembly protein TadD
MRRLIAAAVVIAAIGMSWGAWRHFVAPPAIRAGSCTGCNVLLITIDTLRRDRVGAFGGRTGLTPTLDRLAAAGLRLTRAYASAPLTLPSHTSILTGVSPPAHGVRTNGLFRLGPRLPTLATILRAHGYRTGAFVGAFVLDARFGLDRGFDLYDDRYGEAHPGDPGDSAERRAEDVIRPAAAWILERDYARGSVAGNATSNKWFAWVHLYDPHEPYRAPEPYASQHEPYDAEVAYTDATIGAFLDRLAAARQLDRTLVVVAADHGESLGDHGERTHGVFAYDVTLGVPWIIWSSSRIAGRTFDGPVRLIDLAPTVLDLVGIPIPDTVEGRSILGALDGRDHGPPPVYFEAADANLTRNWAPLTGIISSDHKFIDLPVPELYDLAADPSETTNVYARDRERARTLELLLRDTKSTLAARGATAEKTTLGADARRRLQALGYVASPADPTERVYTDADDPKTLIGPANDLNDALFAFRGGSRERGMAAVRAIMRAHPGFTTAYGVLASMLRDSGDLAGAIATLEDIAERGVADQSVMVVLAGYLQEAGALQRSIELLEAVVAAHPDYADAYNSLGVVYSRGGRHDRAQAAFRKVLELDPTSATAYENLGVDDLGAGKWAEALTELARALELDPRLARAHNALAAVLMRQRHTAEAIAHWQDALQLDPTLYDALFNVGVTLWDAGRRGEARPYLERFEREAPAERYAADIARIRTMLGQ